MLEIRQEKINDYEEVYSVVKTAFETAEHSDGNEQDLVIKLRKSDNFIPELSLVAIKDNKIVGYILSGDPTYITSYKNARALMRRLERDEILEELIGFYISNHVE